jgi:Tol biopolymer transport system component
MRNSLLTGFRRLGSWLGGLALLLPAVASAGEVRFMPDDGHAYNPVWSADGKFIAFEVNRYGGGGVDLFLSSVTGSIAKDARKLTMASAQQGGFGATAPVAINPNWLKQSALVFEGNPLGNESRLYFMPPTGASASELIRTDMLKGNISFPSFSPDGMNLAFVSGLTGDGDIRTWNRSTNALTQVTSTEGTEVFPLYSSDGARLLFTRKVNNTEDVFEYTFASKSERSVIGGGGDQTRPAYAAGGHVVYFTSERGSGSELWDIATVDSAGQNKRILSKDVRLPLRARPALSPDGSWVAWVSSDPTRDSKVMLTKLDGSKTVEVQTEFKACGEPAITVQAGRTLLAFTYLPQSGADWRHLHILDITDKL